MMPKKPNRKQRFRIALILADLTAEQWAEQHGITAGYLSTVLAGKFESKRLGATIDAFADDMLKQFKIHAETAAA